jgi:hypothetical protein
MKKVFFFILPQDTNMFGRGHCYEPFETIPAPRGCLLFISGLASYFNPTS